MKNCSVSMSGTNNYNFIDPVGELVVNTTGFVSSKDTSTSFGGDWESDPWVGRWPTELSYHPNNKVTLVISLSVCSEAWRVWVAHGKISSWTLYFMSVPILVVRLSEILNHQMSINRSRNCSAMKSSFSNIKLFLCHDTEQRATDMEGNDQKHLVI